MTPMNFHSPEGERVQTSNISNKPASIALNYHERMERINQEWYEHLEKQYLMLDEEIRFFEAALSALSGYLPEFMQTWWLTVARGIICVSIIISPGRWWQRTAGKRSGNWRNCMRSEMPRWCPIC